MQEPPRGVYQCDGRRHAVLAMCRVFSHQLLVEFDVVGGVFRCSPVAFCL